MDSRIPTTTSLAMEGLVVAMEEEEVGKISRAAMELVED
jgi:hypothetical protein